MNCPACHTALLMSEREGIEIDYCPACRGVWLDRGELDKIIERAAAAGRLDMPGTGLQQQPDLDRRNYSGDENDNYPQDQRYHRGRKKSFWSEMFDFD